MTDEEALNRIEKINNVKYRPPSSDVIFSQHINSAYNIYKTKQVQKIINNDSNLIFII